MTTYTIKIRKLGTELAIDFARFAENVATYAIVYGLTQIFNDCHSSVIRENYKNDADFRKDVQSAIEAKMAAMLSGDIRVAGERAGNPEEARALDKAEARLMIAFRAQYGKKARMANPRKEAAAYLKDHPELLEQAKAEIAQEKKDAENIKVPAPSTTPPKKRKKKAVAEVAPAPTAK